MKSDIFCNPFGDDDLAYDPIVIFVPSNCTYFVNFMDKAGCGLPSNHDVDTSNVIFPLTIAEIQKLENNSDGAANPFALLSSSLIAIAAALTLN